MKAIKPLIITLALILLSSDLSFAAKSYLFDQFGNLSCKDERVRLDNLLSVLKDFPDHTIHIFVYAGRLSRRGEAKARLTRIKNYFVTNRGLDINRIKFEEGGFREDLTVEIFLLPPSVSSPIAHPTISPEGVKFRPGKIKKSELSCVGS